MFANNKKRFMFAALVMILFMSWSGDLRAFCIYNKTHYNLRFKQISGERWKRGFNKLITVNKKACCNWKNRDCNKKKKRDTKIWFAVQKWSAKAHRFVTIGKTWVKAGGWLVVAVKNNTTGEKRYTIIYTQHYTK